MPRKNAIRLLVAAIGLAVFGFFAPDAQAEANPVVYRALIMRGNEAYPSDSTELASALQTPKSGNPAVASYSSVASVSILSQTWTFVRDQIKTTFQQADSNDVSLIVVNTSGLKVDDGTDQDDANTGDELVGDCENLPCDEKLTTIGNPDVNDPKAVLDDSFDDLFAPFQVGANNRFDGPKIVVISSCYSGGMADGSRDLPVANSVVLMSSGTNELSHGQSPAFQNDANRAHMWFLGFLIAGLADNGSGKARADNNPQDNEVTVKELFDYASPKVTAAESSQHPQKNYAQGSGDWIVLKYNNSTSQNPTLIQHSETKWTGSATNKNQCGCQSATCPFDDGGSVGGIAKWPDVTAPSQDTARPSDGDAPRWSLMAAGVLGAIALGGVVWYAARRRGSS